MTTDHHIPRRRREGPARLLYATLAALTLIAGALVASTSRPPTAVSEGATLSVAEECQRALGYPARTAADRAWLRQCVHALTPPSPAPSGSPTPVPSSTTATPTPTVAPTTTPPVTTVPPTPSTTAPPVTTPPPTSSSPPAPGGCPPFPAFPDADCTGWRHTGATLVDCNEGDATPASNPDNHDGHLERAGARYVGCRFPRGVIIQAPNITIQSSWILGVVAAHWSTDFDYMGAVLTDVEIGPSTDPNRSAVSAGPNITLLRINAHDTASGIALGNNSSLTDSWVHDRLDTGAHGSAVGVGQGSGSNTRVIHNNLDCAPPNGQQHCSGAAVFYDENGVHLHDITVADNLLNSISGYCFRNGPDTSNIVVVRNVFGRKYHDQCGLFGPVAAFYVNNPGNVWRDNRYPDGTPVAPSSST